MTPPLRISLPLYSFYRLCWNVGWHPITSLPLTICTAPQPHPNLLSLSPLLNSNLTSCYRLLTVNVQPIAAANPPFSPLHSSKARHHFDQIDVEQLTTDGHFHLIKRVFEHIVGIELVYALEQLRSVWRVGFHYK